MLFLTVSDVLESQQLRQCFHPNNVCEQERQWKAVAMRSFHFGECEAFLLNTKGISDERSITSDAAPTSGFPAKKQSQPQNPRM